MRNQAPAPLFADVQLRPLQALTQRALNGESDRSLKFGKSSGMWLVSPCRVQLRSCFLMTIFCGVLVASCALSDTHTCCLPLQFNDRGWDHEDNLGKGKHIEFGDVGQNTVELWTLESGGGWVHPIHVHLVVSWFAHLASAAALLLQSCCRLSSDDLMPLGLPTCAMPCIRWPCIGWCHPPITHKWQESIVLLTCRSCLQDFFCVAWQGADWDGKAASASTPWKPCPSELRYAPKDVSPHTASCLVCSRRWHSRKAGQPLLASV